MSAVAERVAAWMGLVESVVTVRVASSAPLICQAGVSSLSCHLRTLIGKRVIIKIDIRCDLALNIISSVALSWRILSIIL